MAQIAIDYQTEWQKRESTSLAGQTATVVHRNGSRKLVRLGPDVKLRRENRGQTGATALLHPVVEGHLDPTENNFDPEDENLILSDGSVFRISFSHRNFFFAVEPQRTHSNGNGLHRVPGVC